MQTKPQEQIVKIPHPSFIEEMRKIKSDAEAGSGRPLAEIVKKWNIKL